MQLWGSFSQSVLHLNLSHASQPMGGVRANPFSSACTPTLMASAPNNIVATPPDILEEALHEVLAYSGCDNVDGKTMRIRDDKSVETALSS